MDLGAAIGVAGWFIQTLFDKYITDMLEKWASDIGVNEEYKLLKNNLEYIRIVLASAHGGKKIQNHELVKYIQNVQYVIYQAENLLDEMQYYRIERDIIEERSSEASSSASQDSVSVFSTLKSYIPLPRNNDDAKTSASKRKIDGDLGLDRNKRTKFPRDDLSHRIQIMVEKLDEVGKKLYKVLKLEKLDQNVRASEDTNTIQPLKASHLVESRVFGRDDERESIIGQLIGGNFAKSNLSILPIVGNGGIGKTTLARLVFNDTKIENCFELQMWIHVSMDFDEGRIIRELLEFVPCEERRGVENLNRLLEILKKFLSSKRFLLVLDDVWEDKDKSKWERLHSLLESEGKNGSAILLTTRKLSVAKIVSDKYMIKLGGLKENDFWDLFRSYAFSDEKYENNGILQRIGKEICNKLSGYPLAAKTVGAMLNKNPAIICWKNARDNEEWKNQNGPDDIMIALRLSYESLPFHLQKCFSFCSLFQKGKLFDRKDIVNIWVAQGFVCLNNYKMRVRVTDIGNMYLNDLIDSGFFDEAKDECGIIYYVIHDLMHDLAQMISQHECFTIDNTYCTRGKLPNTIRHLSIITKKSDYQLPNGNFEKNLVEVQNNLEVENLSTLIIIGIYSSNFVIALTKFIKRLKRVRVLMISQMSRDTYPLTCNFSEFIHLRYLRLNFYREKKNHNDLLDDVNKLYQLEVLDLRNWAGIPRLIEYMDNLVSLRYIEIIHYNKVVRDIARVGNLTALQELRSFEVKKESGFEITQLGNLIYLEGSLVISGLKYVESKEEAMGARLEHKPLLSELHLSWDGNRGDTQPVVQADVLEGLKPNPNLIDLTISGYGGIASPTWLTNDCVLDQLTAIKLQNCKAWVILPPFGNLLSLKRLTLRGMHAVKETNSLFYGSGVDMGFQALEEMEVDDMPELKRWMGTNECQAFPRLKKLWIQKCPKLTKFHPLEFVSSCDNNKNCFTLLNELKITVCSSLPYLSREGMCGLINLKTLHIGDTPELFSSFRPDELSVEKNFLPQSLANLKFESCDITGKQLSSLLLNLLNLCKLIIINCQQIMCVEIVDTSCFSGSIPFSISPNSNEGLLQIPCSLISTLKELTIRSCSNHVFISKEVFGGLRSIENLDISGSSNFTSDMVSQDQIDGSHLLSPSLRE